MMRSQTCPSEGISPDYLLHHLSPTCKIFILLFSYHRCIIIHGNPSSNNHLTPFVFMTVCSFNMLQHFHRTLPYCGHCSNICLSWNSQPSNVNKSPLFQRFQITNRNAVQKPVNRKPEAYMISIDCKPSCSLEFTVYVKMLC